MNVTQDDITPANNNGVAHASIGHATPTRPLADPSDPTLPIDTDPPDDQANRAVDYFRGK